MKLVDIMETPETTQYPEDELLNAMRVWWADSWGATVDTFDWSPMDDAAMGMTYTMLVNGLPDDVPGVVQEFVNRARS
jgi:hypothetical protein